MLSSAPSSFSSPSPTLSLSLSLCWMVVTLAAAVSFCNPARFREAVHLLHHVEREKESKRREME